MTINLQLLPINLWQLFTKKLPFPWLIGLLLLGGIAGGGTTIYGVIFLV